MLQGLCLGIAPMLINSIIKAIETQCAYILDNAKYKDHLKVWRKVYLVAICKTIFYVKTTSSKC